MQYINYFYVAAVAFVGGLSFGLYYHAKAIAGYNEAATKIGVTFKKIEGEWVAFKGKF